MIRERTILPRVKSVIPKRRMQYDMQEMLAVFGMKYAEMRHHLNRDRVHPSPVKEGPCLFFALDTQVIIEPWKIGGGRPKGSKSAKPIKKLSYPRVREIEKKKIKKRLTKP